MTSIPFSRALTLGERLTSRDASIAVRIGVLALAGLRAKRLLRTASTATGRAIVMVFAVLASVTSRHGLVLGGISAWVLAAWQYGTIAGLVALGSALFFLELRRR